MCIYAFALTGRETHNEITITRGAASLCPGLCAFALTGRETHNGMTITKDVATLSEPFSS